MKPPCDSCAKPKSLFSANETAFTAWDYCNMAGRDGMNGRMKIESITAILDALGGSDEDIEKVLFIEKIARDNMPENKQDE